MYGLRKMRKAKRLLNRYLRLPFFWFISVCLFCVLVVSLMQTHVHSSGGHNSLRIFGRHRSRNVFHAGVAAERKIYLKRIRLQRKLSKLLPTLGNWQLNKTGIMELKQQLKDHLELTQFICTKKSCPLGSKYYDTVTMHNRSMTIHKEMLELLPMESPFKTVGAMFKSCAVVGNGGILRNSSCGKKIDQSDFVFRSNLQPIQEYVRDAGSKVNFSTISQSLLSNFRYPDTYKYILNFTNFNTSKFISAFDEYKDFILWIPNSRYSSNMTFNITQLVRKTTNLQMLLYNVEHSEKIQTFWNLTRKGLSTGLILTSIGLSLCDEVNLYGFWPFPFDHKGRDLPMHYTEDLLWDTYRNFHDYPSEFILLTKLHRQGVLKLHLDKCFVDSLS